MGVEKARISLKSKVRFKISIQCNRKTCSVHCGLLSTTVWISLAQTVDVKIIIITIDISTPSHNFKYYNFIYIIYNIYFKFSTNFFIMIVNELLFLSNLLQNMAPVLSPKTSATLTLIRVIFSALVELHEIFCLLPPMHLVTANTNTNPVTPIDRINWPNLHP